VPPSDGMFDLDRVTLYRAPSTVADADALADWLAARLGADVDVAVRDRFVDRVVDADRDRDGDGTASADDPARAFARARVLSPYERETGSEMVGIVRYERRALETPERAGGVIYDGLAIQRALGARIPAAERRPGHCHVILTGRVLGTWGDHDGRWHKRVNVLGRPALVSVPGLYEAPAKPEAYYRAKQSHALVTGDAPPREVLEEEVEGEFLVADDPRTTAALRGYVLQTVHYLRTGEPFCEDERCRLANPHRQPGVVRAQLREPEFCERHAERYRGESRSESGGPPDPTE